MVTKNKRIVMLFIFFVCLPFVSIAAPTPPVFPTEYSARLHNEAVNANGGKQVINCDIHYSKRNNATAYLNCGQPLKPGGKGSAMQTVFKYNDSGPSGGNTGTVYYVFGYGPGGNTCNFWCDLQGAQQMSGGNSLEQYDYTKSAVFNGTFSDNNTQINRFTWNDMLGPIAMNELYLDVTTKDNTPLFMHRKVTPFGKDLGYLTTNYSAWSSHADPASVFVVPGRASCSEGEDAQCQNAMKMYGTGGL